MIFIDGVGIGKEDYQNNPFFKYQFKTFLEIFGKIPSAKNEIIESNGSFIFPTDARLGVEGFPQSGTGQTAIFCGVNASQIIGKHFGPYPYSTLLPIIQEQNIFKYFLAEKKKVFFANAYPKLFFDYLKSGKPRLSVTSLSCRFSGVRLNHTTDVLRGRALTAEVTNERWNQKLGYKLPVIKPETAARRLLKIAGQNFFTLYEYYLTDYIGHGRYDGNVEDVIKTLDEFLFTVLDEMDRTKITLLICSDHGNFEDLSIKTHTLNPSLTISAGKNAGQLFKSIKDISQIKKAIIEVSR
ncbi:MAG: metalloenzyme [Ignavibacteriaceae bacterium]